MDKGAENKLKVTLDPRPAVNIDAEALVSYVFESENEQGPVEGVIADLDHAAGGVFSRLAASGELTGKTGEMTLVHFVPGLAPQRVLLVGAGKRGKFGAAELRRLAATAVRYFKTRAVTRLAFLARETHRDATDAQAITEGLILGSFDGDKYRTDKTAKQILTSLKRRANHRTARGSNPSRWQDSTTRRRPASIEEQSSRSLRISRVSWAMSPRTSSPPPCSPNVHKPWPRKPAWPLRLSMKSAWPN